MSRWATVFIWRLRKTYTLFLTGFACVISFNLSAQELVLNSFNFQSEDYQVLVNHMPFDEEEEPQKAQAFHDWSEKARTGARDRSYTEEHSKTGFDFFNHYESELENDHELLMSKCSHRREV